jgi:hypothetical protein
MAISKDGNTMQFARALYNGLPLSLRIRLKSLIRLGYVVNLRNPRTFNEKINWFKLYGWNEFHVRCADKIAVREYVRDVGYQDSLNDAIVFSREFPFHELRSALGNFRDAFLKANHNSGPVMRVQHEQSDDELLFAYRAIKKQLLTSYGHHNGESWYDSIQPRALCERTLLTSEGALPADYKFHVFNNKSSTKVILQYDYDRFTDHARTLFSEDLDRLPYSLQYKNRFVELKKPENYGKMLTLARALAKPFPYARVDLYNLDGAIYFGEMTFAPDGGFSKFSERAVDLDWGRLIEWRGVIH